MGYQQVLRQARDLLEAEIADLRRQLEHKEASLKRLQAFLREPQPAGERTSLTQEIVTVLYNLVQDRDAGVPAREVVEAFTQRRGDVNESTIRSTLYQVTRKLSPTPVKVGDGVKHVKVRKHGPLYDVEEISPETLTINR
ncbi:MAG TPA: hypothetical protein GX008_11905 [Firmicutes bacterium]|jgi:hypothetical protein|nr:MAG: hypothetical protein AA931_06435 [Peptococcaceae bacterium 1109]HHT74403.1 hypothetical protein [Bacillota bacterium]